MLSVILLLVLGQAGPAVPALPAKATPLLASRIPSSPVVPVVPTKKIVEAPAVEASPVELPAVEASPVELPAVEVIPKAKPVTKDCNCRNCKCDPCDCQAAKANPKFETKTEVTEQEPEYLAPAPKKRKPNVRSPFDLDNVGPQEIEQPITVYTLVDDAGQKWKDPDQRYLMKFVREENARIAAKAAAPVVTAAPVVQAAPQPVYTTVPAYFSSGTVSAGSACAGGSCPTPTQSGGFRFFRR